MVVADLREIWQDIAQSSSLWQGLRELGSTYGLAAGGLAADWYDELRADANVGGKIVIDLAPMPSDGLFRWIADDAQSGDPATAFDRTQGEMQRMVANQHRSTITDLAGRDRYAAGWARVGSGDTCDFCRMLTARGAVYSAPTARFASHPNCHCLAAPKFGRANDLAPALPYSKSPRQRSERWRKQNAKRTREWIAENL